MSNSPQNHFANVDASKNYDEKNRQLAPIISNIHFLIRLILREQPQTSRVLCVGVGTGEEILSLAREFPKWTFVGVDPAAPMLEVCRARLNEAGVLDRCELIHGYVQDIPLDEKFDSALSILVAHFVNRENRLNFYKGMSDRLRKNGYLINVEISYDLDSKSFPTMLKNWEGVQAKMGATPESLAMLPKLLKEMLNVITQEETENLLRLCGIKIPTQFFQAFMIRGWYGRKED